MSILALYLLSLFLLFAASMIVLRVLVRRDYARTGNLSISSAVLQVLIFLAFGGYPSIYLPPDWPAAPVNLPLQIIGSISLIFGLMILSIGTHQLGFRRSLGLQTGMLISNQCYQVTRNPQVLGCILYVIGFTLLWPSWFALGWGLSLIVILHVMVLTEEEHLLNTHHQDYVQYCKRVPRYLRFSKET